MNRYSEKERDYVAGHLSNYIGVKKNDLKVFCEKEEKELKDEKDIIKSINEYVHIDFLNHYQINAKIKVLELEGYLRSFENNVFEIEYNNKGQIKKLQINKNEIKLIRLAIKF